MTISTCMECNRNLGNPITNTDEAIQLSCNDNYHLSCLARKLITRELNNQSVECPNPACREILVAARSTPITSQGFIHPEDVRAHIERIEQNPDFISRIGVDSCLNELKENEMSLSILFNEIKDIDNINNKALFEKTVKEWIIDKNIKNPSVTLLLIKEMIAPSGALRTLSAEIRTLQKMPPERWSENKVVGPFAVEWYQENSCNYRFRISPDFLRNATTSCMYNEILDKNKFEESISYIKQDYANDPQVLNNIKKVIDLRENICALINGRSSAPIDHMISLIKDLIQETKENESNQKTILLIIEQILHGRYALRSLEGELDRWKFQVRWPKKMKSIQYFDENGQSKTISIEEFKNLVHEKYGDATKIYNIICFSALTAAVAIVAFNVLSD